MWLSSGVQLSFPLTTTRPACYHPRLDLVRTQGLRHAKLPLLATSILVSGLVPPRSGVGSLSLLICSRATAIEQGRTRYFTGEDCLYGHTSERFVRNRSCVECHKRARQPGGPEYEARVASRKHGKVQARNTARLEKVLGRG